MSADIWGRPILVLGWAGIQFLTFSFIAERMMRTYYESQNKKPYTIREVFDNMKLYELSEEVVVV